jgi:hypothetical protein
MLRKNLLGLGAAALLAASALPAQDAPPSAKPPAPVGPDAVWTPPAGFLDAFRAACASAGAATGACFVEEMRKAGASPAALEFARQTGNQGYMTLFRETGRVDIAYAEFPFRANENRLVFLVNGDPPMLDVDDTSRIGQAGLDANRPYAGLKKAFPNVTLFPGDRFDIRLPRAVKRRREEGQRFVVVYELRDGCRACRDLGYARIGLDFDALGRFVGTDVEQVRPNYVPAKKP